MNPGWLDVSPPLPLSAYWRRPTSELPPFPLGEASCTLRARGRHGLYHGVADLGFRPGDEILVPAYHHGSEVEALVRAGLTVRFYEANGSLEPDATELERLVGPRVRALYIIHYLGFPQDDLRWRRWCDERGLLLLEDAAQAWLASKDGRPVGSLGDLSIFCLYKTFGIPDGAALFLPRLRPKAADSKRRLGLEAVAHLHVAWLLARSPQLAQIVPRPRRESRYVPEEDFALGEPSSPPSATSIFLLPRVARPGAAERRRMNYRLLLSELGDLVPPPFAAVPKGASPFALPIESHDKKGLLERLQRRGLFALDFWSVPHPSMPAWQFPEATARRKRTVGLPVHQELRRQDVEWVARAVRDSV